MPLIVPGVSVVVAPPPAFVVRDAAPKVPSEVVSVTVAFGTGTESTVKTVTLIVVDPPPITIVLGWLTIPKLLPKLLGPVKSSTTAWQPQEIAPSINNIDNSFL
jgi:hypothetical protein